MIFRTFKLLIQSHYTNMPNTTINQYGLSRYIPSDVSYEIRKNSGFGCVICGGGIIEYEHVEPAFKDSKTHDPTCITLLCPTCHAKKTRKYLSVDTIKKAMQNPHAKNHGYSKEFLDLCNISPKLIFAGTTFKKCRIPITIGGRPILIFDPPETENGPYLLTAKFWDNDGTVSLEIIKNEWRAYTSNWDVEVTGGEIRIKQNKILHLILSNPNNITVEISHLVLAFGNQLLYGAGNEIKIIDRRTARITQIFRNCGIDTAAVGISI